jgi:hypothetical protein
VGGGEDGEMKPVILKLEANHTLEVYPGYPMNEFVIKDCEGLPEARFGLDKEQSGQLVNVLMWEKIDD